MKRAFICDTPFQLFNTLNFVMNNFGNDNDLYLVDHFNGAEKILKNIELEKFFNHIYFVIYDVRGQKDFDLIWYLKRMYYYMYPKNTILRNVKNVDTKTFYKHYQEIYASIVTCFVACMVKKNPIAKLIMIDDGMGSYSGNLIEGAVGWKHRLFAKFFHCGSNVVKPDKLLVNNVKMCKSTVSEVIRPLPPVTEYTLEVAELVFGKEKESASVKNVIWLTQPDDGYTRKNEINHRIAEILEDQKDKILVRMHPRDKMVQMYTGFELDKADQMWELYVATTDMDNKILISCYSTAMFTPKIIFGKEPILIFLYKLYDDELTRKNLKNFQQMIAELRNEYVHKERIIIVEDFAVLKTELFNALEMIEN